jgi:hypothetical protein
MNKHCTICKEVKPLSDFNRRSLAADGHASGCRECVKATAQKWREANRDKIRASHREYSRSPSLKEAAKRRVPRYKDKSYNIYRPQKNRLKRHAREVLNKAIRYGNIIRPDRCERCKKICKPHGHHHDYSLPLKVEWLCSPCHGEETILQNETARKEVLNAKTDISRSV